MTNAVQAFVNGRSHGLFTLKSSIKAAVDTEVTIFSGSPPKGIRSENWEKEKRVNASVFKSNKAPILVAPPVIIIFLASIF